MFCLSVNKNSRQVKMLTKVDEGRLSHNLDWGRICRQDVHSAEVSILKEDHSPVSESGFTELVGSAETQVHEILNCATQSFQFHNSGSRPA